MGVRFAAGDLWCLWCLCRRVRVYGFGFGAEGEVVDDCLGERCDGAGCSAERPACSAGPMDSHDASMMSKALLMGVQQVMLPSVRRNSGRSESASPTLFSTSG